MPQEHVLADFDCYYPYKPLPLWKIIIYSFLSMGLFLIIVLYRMIQRYCVEKECCTPTIVEFSRGKVNYKRDESLEIAVSFSHSIV